MLISAPQRPLQESLIECQQTSLGITAPEEWPEWAGIDHIQAIQ